MPQNSTSSKESRKSLSNREQQLLSRLSSQNKSIITIKDIQNTINVSYDTARKFAKNLADKKWLDRLERGTYLIVPLSAGEEGIYTEHEFIIGTSLVEEGYISYWSALDHFGWTEQTPMTVFIATPKQKQDREIHGVQYKFVTITDEKYFGFEQYPIESHRVPIAVPEKVLVDCADHPEYCGGIRELAKALYNARSELDYDQLVEFLERQGNGAAIKRLVFLADTLRIDLPDRRWLESQFTTGYSKLDPTIDRDGHHDSQYNLKVNISKDEILDEVGL